MPVDIRGDYRNRGRRHAGDAGSLTESGGPNLRQSLHHFPRKARNGVKGELFWDRTVFLPFETLDGNELPPQIALVFELSLHRGDVERRLWVLDVERNLPLRDQRRQPHLRMLESAGRGGLRTGNHDNGRTNGLAIRLKPAPTILESAPPVIVHEAQLTSTRRQSKVCIVSAKQQPVFGA